MTRVSTKAGIGVLFSLMVAFAAIMPAAPASAARTAPRQNVGKFSMYVFDADSATKRPIAKAEVTVHNVSIVMHGWTDEYGMFTGMLNEGMYWVTVNADKYNSTTLDFLVKGGAMTELDAPLNKTVITEGSLSLYVWDASGAFDLPLAGAGVAIINSIGEVVTYGKTNEFGYFEVKLVPDVYTLDISADGYAGAKEGLIVNAGETSWLSLDLKK